MMQQSESAIEEEESNSEIFEEYEKELDESVLFQYSTLSLFSQNYSINNKF